MEIWKRMTHISILIALEGQSFEFPSLFYLQFLNLFCRRFYISDFLYASYL